MTDYSPDLQPEEKYNAFLYEPITEQDNGTPVSVLSALTRGNHDPWEEAARLSRLPPDRAQRVLVELLNESVGRKLSFAEKEAAAKRLLPLLPAGIGFVPIVSGSPAAADAARHLVYWLAWFGFIAMLLLVRPQDRAPMADPELPLASSSVSGVVSGVETEANAGKTGWIVNRAHGDRNR